MSRVRGRTQSNLPAEITSFVGRRQELANTRRLLAGARLVTLTGVGGVGKTRLALRAATDARGTYEDGVWLVELADCHDPDGLLTSVTASLGLNDQSGRLQVDTIVEHLDASHCLLVLDNCEHLLEACAALVFQLLRECPGLSVLATSREPLGMTGEAVSPVPPLTVPDPETDPSPANLAHIESVGLFAQRAAASLPDFVVTPENCCSVVRLCHELEGIPLAIELAAVWVRALPLEMILARLQDHFSLAERRSPGVARHQNTLRASVDWSYRLCSETEQVVWSRLSSFAGGFELDAAESICADDQLSGGRVTDCVISLVEKSILLREERQTRTRYRMLETLRQYGQERLGEREEEDQLRRRHRDWYLGFVEQQHAGWLGADQGATLVRLRHEYNDLRLAYRTSLENFSDVDAALRLATALEHYWMASGLITEGRHWLDEALSAADREAPARARALRVDAYLTALLGDTTTADNMLVAARAIAESRADSVEVGYVDLVAGIVRLCVGDCAAALERAAAALDRFENAKEPAGAAYALVVLASLAAAEGDRERAGRWHQRCVDVTVPYGDLLLSGFSGWALGVATLREGDRAAAASLLRSSLRQKDELDDVLGMALCVESLAWVEAADGNDELAATLLGATTRLWGPLHMSVAAIIGFGQYRAEYEISLRERLGERRWEKAFREGALLPTDRGIALALADDKPAPASQNGPLSPRENVIAALIAQGQTNRKISQELIISQRTVEGHVEKILDKLGFANRTQIASWAASHLG